MWRSGENVEPQYSCIRDEATDSATKQVQILPLLPFPYAGGRKMKKKKRKKFAYVLYLLEKGKLEAAQQATTLSNSEKLHPIDLPNMIDTYDRVYKELDEAIEVLEKEC